MGAHRTHRLRTCRGLGRAGSTASRNRSTSKTTARSIRCPSPRRRSKATASRCASRSCRPSTSIRSSRATGTSSSRTPRGRACPAPVWPLNFSCDIADWGGFFTTPNWRYWVAPAVSEETGGFGLSVTYGRAAARQDLTRGERFAVKSRSRMRRMREVAVRRAVQPRARPGAEERQAHAIHFGLARGPVGQSRDDPHPHARTRPGPAVRHIHVLQAEYPRPSRAARQVPLHLLPRHSRRHRRR